MWRMKKRKVENTKRLMKDYVGQNSRTFFQVVKKFKKEVSTYNKCYRRK